MEKLKFAFCRPSLQKFLSFYTFCMCIVLSISQKETSRDRGARVQSCSILYSGRNFQDESFSIQENDSLDNLIDPEETGVNSWNVTGSIFVKEGCRLKVCSDTYFDGDCKILRAGFHRAANITERVESVFCSCPKQCDCSAIHIKKSSCGRAYLAGGCSTCQAMYANLHINSKGGAAFPEDEARNVEAFRLRSGCTLTVYQERGLKGTSRNFNQEIVEDFQGNVGSYQCKCNDSLYMPRVKPPRPESYPVMITMPSEITEISDLLKTDALKNHSGLLDARKSYRNGRSTRNAYILILGSTGAGKSSAVNLLFDDHNLTRIGNSNSATSAIHEFCVSVPIDELGISNSNLCIIDTHGLGDSTGLEQDARFLATLDNYLAAHKDLKNRLPNVVLIFHKFSDNRFEGVNSNFVKMLRGFNTFGKRIADEKFSNVIFVFSNFLSVPRTLRQNPNSKIENFKQVIQNYTTFPLPTHITLAENKAREEGLPMINGYYKLPNGDYYPKNLFDKMNLITQTCEDPIGQAVFKSAFGELEEFNISKTDFALLPANTSKVQQYLNMLTNSDLSVEDTEVSKLLQNIWDNNLSPDIKIRYPFSLAYLQKALTLRNIRNILDVPQATSEKVELLSSLQNDPATQSLLELGFNIQAPKFPENVVTGFGYNVFDDKPMLSSPFQMDELKQSDIGFMIPSVITCNLETGIKDRFEFFDNKKEYLEYRQQILGIGGNVIASSNFTNLTQPGYNIKELAFTRNGSSLSVAKDFQYFKMVLNEKAQLTPEFEYKVKSLIPLNRSENASIEIWREFFMIYGTHVVSSAYGGGSINIKLESDKPFDTQITETGYQLLKFADELEIADKTNETSKADVYQDVVRLPHSTKFLGGNRELFSADMANMSLTEIANLLSEWKRSIKTNPVMLTSDLKLIPISRIVGSLGQNYSEEIDKATELWLTNELTYKQELDQQDNEQGCVRDDKIIQDTMKMMREQNELYDKLKLEKDRLEEENERMRFELEEAQNRLGQERSGNPCIQQASLRTNIENQHPGQIIPTSLPVEQAYFTNTGNLEAIRKNEAEMTTKNLNGTYLQNVTMENEKRNFRKPKCRESLQVCKHEQIELKTNLEREFEDKCEKQVDERYQRRLENKDRYCNSKIALIERAHNISIEGYIRAENKYRKEIEDFRKDVISSTTTIEKLKRNSSDAEQLQQALKDCEKLRSKAESGCLKAGTLILMADGSQKRVEMLKIGDFVKGIDMRPTEVIGVAKEFLLNQRFYGFQNTGPFFFTNNHIFVGPRNTEQSYASLELYAASTLHLYENNPLMAYLNVKNLHKNISLFSIENATNLVVSNDMHIFEDKNSYSKDTFMYDIQLDSLSGTYFANGYACRHEIPPMHIWPNTIEMLLWVLKAPAFVTMLPTLPYTVKNVYQIHDIIDDLAIRIKNFLGDEEKWKLLDASSYQSSNEFSAMSLEEGLSLLFNSSCVSTAAVRLYSRIGPIVAPYLDPQDGSRLVDEVTAKLLQHKLVALINDVVSNSLIYAHNY